MQHTASQREQQQPQAGAKMQPPQEQMQKVKAKEHGKVKGMDVVEQGCDTEETVKARVEQGEPKKLSFILVPPADIQIALGERIATAPSSPTKTPTEIAKHTIHQPFPTAVTTPTTVSSTPVGFDDFHMIEAAMLKAVLAHEQETKKVLRDPPSPPPGLVSPLPSVGSAAHASGTCRPCAWFWKGRGCENGRDCRHCHLCPEDEIKMRKKAKALQMKEQKRVEQLLQQQEHELEAAQQQQPFQFSHLPTTEMQDLAMGKSSGTHDALRAFACAEHDPLSPSVEVHSCDGVSFLVPVAA